MAASFKFLIVIISVLVAYFYLNSGHVFEPESLRGKRVLVTGASSGIGEQVALKYAHLGAELVVTARRRPLLEAVADKCKQIGAKKVVSIVADMAVAEDRKMVAETTLKELGGQLDFLVLNHAIIDHGLWLGNAENMSKLETMNNVNFVSYVDLASQFLKALEQSKGHLVVVSSLLGKMGLPGSTIYSSTKHALNGFFASLRQELKFRGAGVSVTLIVFGMIKTKRLVDMMDNIPKVYDVVNLAGDAEEAAQALVEGASARKYEIYYPKTASLMVWFHKLFQDFFEDLQQNYLQPGAQF